MADWIRPVVRPQYLSHWLSLYMRWTPLRDAYEEVRVGIAGLVARRDELRAEADALESQLQLKAVRIGGCMVDKTSDGRVKGRIEQAETVQEGD